MCRKPTILAYRKKKIWQLGQGVAGNRVLAYDPCTLFNKSRDVGVYIVLVVLTTHSYVQNIVGHIFLGTGFSPAAVFSLAQNLGKGFKAR